jgi:hypothetical protein
MHVRSREIKGRRNPGCIPGYEGTEKLGVAVIGPITPPAHTVRLHFAGVGPEESGKRQFDIALQEW